MLSFKITSENVHDSEMLVPLMKQLENRVGPGKIKKTLGDMGYDSNKNFNYLERRRAGPGIRPRDTANPLKEQAKSRKRTAKMILSKGYEKGRDKIKYGLRWIAETFFSTYKRLYGEFLRATSTEGMQREIIMNLHFYNQLITYKRPSQNR